MDASEEKRWNSNQALREQQLPVEDGVQRIGLDYQLSIISLTLSKAISISKIRFRQAASDLVLPD